MKTRSIKKFFSKAAKAIGVGIGSALTLYAAFILTFYTGRGEKLTDGEQKLIRDVCGQDLDLSNVRKHLHKKSDLDYKIASLLLPNKAALAMPLTGHIVFFSDSIYAADFSQEKNLTKIGYFMHESIHDMQYKTSMNMKKIGLYKYHLSDEKKFSDFGIEQQAEMVERYVKVAFFNDTSKVPGIDDALLIKTVEDRFPSARVTRDQINAGKQRTGRPDFSWHDLPPDESNENGAVKKTRTSTGRPATTSR